MSPQNIKQSAKGKNIIQNIEVGKGKSFTTSILNFMKKHPIWGIFLVIVVSCIAFFWIILTSKSTHFLTATISKTFGISIPIQ